MQIDSTQDAVFTGRTVCGTLVFCYDVCGLVWTMGASGSYMFV